MKIFLAGATGAVGRPLLTRLLAAGHEVTATSRSAAKVAALEAQGARAIVLDAFDAAAVEAAILQAKPEVVIHQLTALPTDASPRQMKAALAETGRLRQETVPDFAAAARDAGARRLIVQSIAFATTPEGPPVLDEDAPLWLDGPGDIGAAARPLRVMEAAVLGAGIEGVVLRYGFFYGPGTWYSKTGTLGRMIAKRQVPLIGSGEGRQSFVHVDDAAEATVLALDGGASGIYNVTDDAPATQKEWLPAIARELGAKPPRHAPAWLARLVAGDGLVYYATTLRGASNARAKKAFGWQPRAWRDGFHAVFG
ncbi:MAG: NAD(P)-dependent oxidoreductase [Myxococcaceae bacterium]|nr:NAD(P)-dependent oxidoreductase [Myxococcaceae bacterium]